jgi:hypothetical protein
MTSVDFLKQADDRAKLAAEIWEQLPDDERRLEMLTAVSVAARLARPRMSHFRFLLSCQTAWEMAASATGSK